MSLTPINYLLQQRIVSAQETAAQRQTRETKTLQVARQMLANGCCSNSIVRETGLSQQKLREIS